MAVTNVQCIFDSQRAYSGGIKENGEWISPGPPPQAGFFQFNLPALEEIYLSSAKLFFYVQYRGYGFSITPTLYDVKSSLSGASAAIYEDFTSEKLITEGSDVYSPSSSYSDYNQYVSLDITELVIGYLGRNYYTLGLIGKKLSSSNSTTDIGTIESGNPAYIELTYEYATPFKPTLIYPVGDAVSNKGTIMFQWKYNSSGNTGQKKFDLQWKMQADTNWNTISQNTANTYYSMDAGAFTNGIVEWRVRTYNLHNMMSEWSESQFVVIGKPANPVISGVKNDAITEITWNANKSEESAARVRISKAGNIIYDSGVIPAGIEDAYKPDIMLENGNYVALLSISNMYDMWSNEISYPFSINNTKPSVPALQVIGMGDFVKLIFTRIDNAEYFVYRAEGEGSFVPIARVSDTYYEDYAVKSDTRYRYYVRCYLKAYSDSAIKDVSTKYKGYILSLVSSMAEKVLFFFHESEDRIPYEKGIQMDNSLVYYTGRTKPVKETGIQESRTSGLSAYLSKGDIRTLENMISENGIFCLRCKEFIIFCDITGYNAVVAFLGKGYSVNISFQEVYHDERVKFNE